MPTTTPIKPLISAIQQSLTPDLLKPKYRKKKRRNSNKYTGHCYVATEALYHLLGRKKSGYVPQSIRHQGDTHWYLKHRDTGNIRDLTARQFGRPVPYRRGRGTGFLTRKPSKRARILMKRVRSLLKDN